MSLILEVISDNLILVLARGPRNAKNLQYFKVDAYVSYFLYIYLNLFYGYSAAASRAAADEGVSITGPILGFNYFNIRVNN